MSATEAAVLACIMESNSLIHEAKSLGLQPGHFGDIRNSSIYQAMCDMSDEHIPLDLITLSGELDNRGISDMVGGVAYLSCLDTDLPDPSHFAAYLDNVKAAGLRRTVVSVGKQMARVPEGTFTTDQMMEKVQDMIAEIGRMHGGTLSVVEGGKAVDDLVIKLEDGLPLGVGTGYPGFDHYVTGFKPGNYIVIAGRPGMGKTALALNMMHHQVRVQELSAAIFSLEMSSEELIGRLLSCESGVPFGKIKIGALSQDDWTNIANARRRINQYKLYIEDSAGITMSQLAAKAKELQNTKGLDVIYLDYMQLMTTGSNTPRWEEVSSISRQIKVLAKQMKIPVVAMSQLSREVEKRTNKRPMLSDLRESGSIEQDADAICFLYRKGYYETIDNTGGITELIVAKNRHGDTGTVNLVWRGELTQFINPPTGI